MSGSTPRAILGLLRSQLTVHPPPVTSTFEGQTVVVTGSNNGLGKAALKLLLNLNVERVIMAVRSPAKGQEARTLLERVTGRKDVVEVWPLDLAKYSSVLAFGERIKGLERLDAVIANAGVWPTVQSTAQGHEATLTTNVISTSLMAYLVLPKLRESATRFNTTTRLTFVGSQLHKFATLTARKTEGNLIDALDKQVLKKPADLNGRYNDTKLLLQMYGQNLAIEHHTRHGNGVCITVVNPGYCLSNLKPPTDFGTKMFEKILARTTEEGAIALVDAIALEKVLGRHGQYIDDCQIKQPACWLFSQEGKATVVRLWHDLNEVIDEVLPGLASSF